MALVELAAVLWWTERDHARSPRMFLWPALLLLLVIALVARHRADASRRILCRAHIQQLRSLVIASRLVAHGRLEAYTTSRGVRVAVSEAGSGFPTGVHVSLSLVDSHGNLPALAQLAGGAFPRLDVRVARYTERRVLHVVTPVPTPDDPPMSAARADLLYGNLVRHFQGTGNAVPEPPEALDARPQQQWYFAAGNDG